jgi:hypothetical protein
MDRSIGFFFLHISVALYLLMNGILEFRGEKNEMTRIINALFGQGNLALAFIVFFSLCAVVAGIFLVFEIFQMEINFTGILLLVFLAVWGLYIIFTDIINPIFLGYSFFSQRNVLLYLRGLSVHLMVCGGILTAIKSLNREL